MTEQSIWALDEIRRAVCGKTEGGLWRELKLAERIAALEDEVRRLRNSAQQPSGASVRTW